MSSSLTPVRLAVYIATTLVAVFGVVFVADALVESDEERLEAIEGALEGARGEARADALAQLSGEEAVAVVADRRRVWIEPGDGEAALREAIASAVPELTDDTPVVGTDATLAGQRGRITVRLREGHDEPVDVVVELALEDHAFSLLEVRRLR
ncbi:MAG: hypothetical protein K1X94_06095 [Sandaracinaceae bacterium]|nr:hypothetical protein [Sandaracinaceae bacterium]